MASQHEDDLPRRSKLDKKGRHTQKFRNFIKQIDPRDIQDLSEEDECFDWLDTYQKISTSRRV